MLGFLATEPEAVSVPLLGSPSSGSTGPIAAFEDRARSLFREQIEKSGFDISIVSDASLTVSKASITGPAFVNGRQRPTRDLLFVAGAVTDLGRRYEREQVIRASPHDPSIESRSARAGIIVPRDV